MREAIRSWWPEGRAGQALLVLLLGGIGLRLIAIASLWPAADTLDDGYQLFAGNPFDDPQHPAGYGLIVAGLGHVSHSVILPVLIQHLCGIASALLFFAATRRMSGSEWAALLPAGFVLLAPDLIFLEHSVMSETWAVLGSAGGLYAAVRATEDSPARLRWALLAGALLGLTVAVRTATLLMIAVVVLAVFLSFPSPLKRWRVSLPAPAALAGGAIVILLLYSTASAAFGPRFGVAPSPGWYLYVRVAQFADCSKFDPPPGTESLCDKRPPDQRPGAYTLGFDPNGAASKTFGGFGAHDDEVGEWAQRGLEAQPLDFAEAAWDEFRTYWAPWTRPSYGAGLDPQLNFASSRPELAPIVHANLERFYSPFTVDRFQPGLDGLRAVQHVIRFGPLLLAVTTILVLIGLLIGDRRPRIGVLLFGVGGLALIVAPSLTIDDLGRYTVPMAAPLMAAAAIALVSLSSTLRDSNSRPRPPAESAT